MERQIQPVHLSVSDFLFVFCLQTLFLLGMEKTKKDEEKSGDSVLRKKMKIQVISPFKEIFFFDYPLVNYSSRQARQPKQSLLAIVSPEN